MADIHGQGSGPGGTGKGKGDPRAHGRATGAPGPGVEAPGDAPEAGHGEEAHISNRTYVLIGVVLAILTAVEVMVFYVDALQPVLVPILMILMVAKFALVAMYYMHLRFDRRLLTGILSWGVVVATAIILALMAMFGTFTGA